MMRLLAILLFGLLYRVSFEPAAENKPVVTFQIKNAGLAVNGSFADLQTSLRFNPQRLDESKLEASVAVGTVRTGVKLRDGHLQKEGYFDAGQYPRIRMVSKRLEQAGDNAYRGVFDLTIRDVTREVTVPFTCEVKGGTGRFAGSFALDRRHFGVGGNSLLMGDEVVVRIDLEAPLQAL